MVADESPPADTSFPRADAKQLAQWVVWGTLDEALQAIGNPATPEWALRRAAADRHEPEIIEALADATDPEFHRQRRAQAHREERWQRSQDELQMYLEASLATIRQTVALGLPAYLHRKVFVRTDYVVNGDLAGQQPVLDPLGDLGMQGWEVISIIPRTTGIPLTNLVGGGQAYGGGLGGMVTGAWVLMRYRITDHMFAHHPDTVRAVLTSLFEAEVFDPPDPYGDVQSLNTPTPGSGISGRQSTGRASFVGYGMSISQAVGGDESDMDIGE